jgi:hypothetical protein
MNLRTVILVAAGFGIPLALLVALLPIAWGYGGYEYDARGRVTFLDPTGPARRAGLLPGDQVVPLRGMEDFQQLGGRAGTVVHLPVDRNGKIRPINITFEAFRGQLGKQEQFNKVLGAFTALGAFIIAILVILRARDRRAGARAAAVLVAAGLDALAGSSALVAGNAVLATALYYVLPIVLSGAAFWAAFSLLAVFPPRRTRVRSIAGWLGPLCFACSVWFALSAVYTFWSGALSWLYDPFGPARLSTVLIFDALLAVAIVEAIATTPPEFRAATTWLGVCWLLADAIGALPMIAGLLNVYPILISHYADVLNATVVFLFAFGVAYPVLRHRLVDLNILVTRATVFGLVSIVIVGIFIAAEWAIGRIFEQSVGISNGNGFGPEAATLCVVLILGISARPIHRFVEAHLTQMFFRKRLRGLAEIARVAREADVSTDAQAIMDVGCATVKRCLEPLGVACYLCAGDSYALSSSSGTLASPAAYAFNDPVPLRLRRWHEPFEIDDDSDARHHMLFLPMSLRGDLLGFFCCGPKPDRTPYLSDEIEALSLLAHQVGIAAAWLSRTSAAPSLRPIANV